MEGAPSHHFATPPWFEQTPDRPCETLFVPSGWWHTARILEPSITVSANAVNASNWEGFVSDYLRSASRHRSPSALALLAAYLKAFRFIERCAL
jgi:hypothetical protein